MNILSSLGFTLIALAVAGYLVALIRPEHTRKTERDEHEDL